MNDQPHMIDDPITDFINLLLSDVTAAHNDLQKEDTQYRRRTYVRTVFAAIEGYVHFLKQSTLSTLDDDREHFSSVEIALLEELRYEVNQNGEVKVQAATIPTINNLRFALSAFTRTSPGFDLQLRDDNWDILREAARTVRNRLVHPKKLDDLNVSDYDLELVDKAFSWVDDIVRRAFVHSWSSVTDTLKSSIDTIQEIQGDLLSMKQQDMSSTTERQIEELQEQVAAVEKQILENIELIGQHQKEIRAMSTSNEE